MLADSSQEQNPDQQRLVRAADRADDSPFGTNPWCVVGLDLSEQARARAQPENGLDRQVRDACTPDRGQSWVYRWSEDGVKIHRYRPGSQLVADFSGHVGRRQLSWDNVTNGVGG